MLTRYQRTVGNLLCVADAAIMVGAWLLAYWQRFFALPIAMTKGLPPFQTYSALAPLVAMLWMVVFTWMRVYEPHRMMGRVREVRLVLKAHGVALLLFIAITYFFDDYKYSRLVMFWFGASGAVLLGLFRYSLRSGLRLLRARGRNLRTLIAVGEGPTLEGMVQRLERFPELGVRVHGVVTSEQSTATSICGKPVLGRFDSLAEIVARTPIDEVLIALPPRQQHKLDHVLELLKKETVDIGLVPDVHRYVTLGCAVEDFDGVPVVRLNDSPLIGWAAIAKRVTDMVVSLIALVVFSPLLLLLAMLVKLTSPGPVLYAQERMGLDGRTFRMIKFRSMRIQAEAQSGAVWAKPGDDRCTPLGAIMRKTSLDELPQLWNVLRGDMSLVGPRPERPVFVHKFRSEIPNYMLRHKVKAGITGWAQINGWRGNTSLDRRIECDLFYIRNWSYLLDLKILTLTLWKGFVHKNAY